MSRLLQVLEYGWKDASTISNETKGNKYIEYFKIIHCYCRYGVWTNQYRKNRLWEKVGEEYKSLCIKIGTINKEHEKWLKDWHANRKFILKYSSLKYDTSSSKRNKRSSEYQKRFNMGKGTTVQYNVDICNAHYMYGSIRIGKKCFIGKNCFIDYTGKVDIEDNVLIANGTVIETHHRDVDAYNRGEDINIPTSLLIRENAYIGSRVMILDSCNYIGKNARIGAGAVVTKDIPDNALAVGVPAKVIKIIGE